MKLLKILTFGLIIILISRFVYSQWYAIIITNTQSQATPAPFQQQIAICNGTINIGPNFAYVNNPTLFNEINSNGQNVYFTTTSGGSPNIYSWYEGQLNYNGVTCDVWWINLPNGIPANSNITIYMYIGNSSANYYSQYYPYVGVSPQVDSSRQYDNGNYTFIAYGYFNNTFDGWTAYVFYGYFSPRATSNGIQMLNGGANTGTYILPPNNWNIPLIPLIVEEAWYYTQSADANAIALFGNTSQQIYVRDIGPTSGGRTPASNLSTFVQFQYWSGRNPPESQAAMLKSAVTYQYLNYTYFPTSGGTIYSYLIVNSTYVQAGYYYYDSNQVWVPLTLLNMYPLSYNPNYGNYTYYNLDYNPFQYPTLEISAGTGGAASYQYVQWVIARAYPPNGVMPSISIQPAVSVSSVQLSPPSSSIVCPGTQTSSTVTANLDNPNNISTTVTFSCSAPSGITCSLNPSSCTTSGSSCSTTVYVNSSPTTSLGSYSVTVIASVPGFSASATYTYNIGTNISISTQQSSNFQNSYNIYITGCAQNYTLYVNNSPYCYDSYSQFQNINSLCTVSYPGSYSVYARGCYSGTCVNSNTINLNIPLSGITVPIIGINVLNITSQNIYVTISVNGSNQNIQSINVYYNGNNVYSNSNINTNYYLFNLQLPYSNNGNITVCSTLTNGQSGCVTEIFNVNVAQTYIYYGIIQLKAKVQPININTTYGPIGNRLEFSIDYPGYILTLNITNVGNITLNNITINLQQLGNVPEILYNSIPIKLLDNININIDQLQPNQSYILQFNILPLYIGSSSLLLNFKVNGQNIGIAQYNLVVKGPSNKSSLVVSENINYILMLLGIIGSIIFLI